jgi:hypothetical protein
MMRKQRSRSTERRVEKARSQFFERLDSRLCLSGSPAAVERGAAIRGPVSGTPQASISDVRLAEGNSGTKAMNFMVKLSSRPQQTTTVKYQTVAGTATAGSDFIAASGTVTFAAGESSKLIPVRIVGDMTSEADEAFTVTLSSPTNCELAKATATGLITNDDTSARSVSVTGPTAAVVEGSKAAFTLRLSSAAAEAVTVTYGTVDGSAVAGSDYTAASGTVVFAAGEMLKTVEVATTADSSVESDEKFSLRLSAVTGGSTLLGAKSAAEAVVKNATVTPTPNPTPTPSPSPTPESWTIMVYMTGENLNTFARDDVNEMEKALTGLPSNVKIVVSWDQPKFGAGTAYATGGGTQAAWRTYGRSVLTADSSMTSIASTFDLTVGEKNTGDPATLVDFVKWAAQQAPAQRYLLQMWGHGGGLDGSQFDSESGSDSLTIGELGTALAASGMPAIDLVSYDNCLMAMAEIGYAVSQKVVGQYVASEEVISGAGQYYVTAYNALKSADTATVTAAQVAAGMIASYSTQYQGTGTADTFSAVDTSKYAALATAIGQFVTATATLTATDRTAMLNIATGVTSYTYSSFRDLGGFMNGVSSSASLPAAVKTAAGGVKTALTALVSGKTADQRSSSGVSIYLPTSSTDSYLGSYATTAAQFCQATSWNLFAKWLATGTRSAGATGAGTGGRNTSYADGLRLAESLRQGGRGDVWVALASSAGAAAPARAAARPGLQRAFAAFG